MVYTPEKWKPRERVVDAFLISLETIDELQGLLGATSVRTAYNRGGTILIEWTMAHRETFAGLVGQYIIRNAVGEFEVLDLEQLMIQYEPHIEKSSSDAAGEHIGKVLAVGRTDGAITEILVAREDGEPVTFVIKPEEDNKTEPQKDSRKPEDATLESRRPGPPNNKTKPQNQNNQRNQYHNTNFNREKNIDRNNHGS